MPRITWICASGREVEAEVAVGRTLMEAARGLGIEGIHSECGGNLACATCHVVVDPARAAALGSPDAMEDDMLDMVDAGREPTSRLSCQLTVTPAFDGLRLTVPGV
ncbi:2Fe-2S iron-sulfur cluster-binding protein [Frigidibacter sp. MR17.24]|uniref:2Fe-2S iron-sulfur cluster-binding protein n=1 Tax=Frigidibacter sp. MR17.24 TaxID=3127345 RepID=UPI003012E55E